MRPRLKTTSSSAIAKAIPSAVRRMVRRRFPDSRIATANECEHANGRYSPGRLELVPLHLPQILRAEEHDLLVGPEVSTLSNRLVLELTRLHLLDDRSDGGRSSPFFVERVRFLAQEHGDDRVCARRFISFQSFSNWSDCTILSVADVYHFLGAAEDDRREPLRPRGQQVGDPVCRLVSSISVFVTRVATASCRGIARERRHRVDVLIGVEDRVAHPDAEHRDRREHADQHDQHADEDAPPQGSFAGCGSF